MYGINRIGINTMIDKIFIIKHDFQYHFESRLQVAQAKVQNFLDLESLIETIQNWWETVLPIIINDNVKDHEIAEWFVNQLHDEHKFSNYISDEFLYTFNKFFDTSPEYWDETEFDIVGYALGIAIGKSLANTVDIKKMLIAYSLLETQDVGRYALGQSWLEILPTTKHKKAWLKEIHNEITVWSSNPIDCFPERDIEFAKAYLAEWEQTTEISKIWDDYSRGYLHVFGHHLFGILDLVRQLDKASYLNMLEIFTFPIFIRSNDSFSIY